MRVLVSDVNGALASNKSGKQTPWRRLLETIGEGENVEQNNTAGEAVSDKEVITKKGLRHFLWHIPEVSRKNGTFYKWPGPSPQNSTKTKQIYLFIFQWPVCPIRRYQILMRLFYKRHIDAMAAIPMGIMYEKRDFARTYSINRAWIIDDDDYIRLQSSCYYLHR